MRHPNTHCSKCYKPLYRRPTDLEKTKRSLCDQCFDASDHSRRGNDTKYQKYIDRWKAGKESGLRGRTAISGHLRRYLFEMAKASCQSCGWSKMNQTTKLIPLEVNHKDGDFRNNKEENLELLCPSCHSLTDTFRSLNIGRGRPR